MEDYERVKVLLGVFREKVKWTLYYRLKRSGWTGNYDDVSPGLLWNKKEQKVEVEVIDSDEFTQILNTDDKCITEVRAALKEVYRFSAEIVFTAI